MRRLSPFTHCLIALGLIILLTLSFTFLPFKVPAPEPLSPWVYLSSAVVCLIALILNKKSGRIIWLYIPLLLLGLFGFFEETSYGVESGTFQPIYSETYNVEIYDVHNLIPILQQIFIKVFQPADLNHRMSSQFWSIDGYMIFGLVAFLITAQWLTRKAKPEAISSQIFKLTLLTMVLITLSAVFLLLSLPADSKNSLIGGYSPTRLALVTMLLIIGVLLPAIPLFSKKFEATVFYRISGVFSSRRTRVAINILLSFILLNLLAYQLLAPTVTFTGQIAILERVNPLVLWVTASVVLAMIAIPSLDGGFQRSLSQLGVKMTRFFSEHPSYIYALVCILIVAFAQLMDQDVISLSQHIGLDNPWGEEWNYWLEETFEMTGSFEMLAATSLLLIKRAKTNG